MSRNNKFHNPEGAYFVSFAVVEWIDLFTRNEPPYSLNTATRYLTAMQPIGESYIPITLQK
jgi:hypothetical protein